MKSQNENEDKRIIFFCKVLTYSVVLNTKCSFAHN